MDVISIKDFPGIRIGNAQNVDGGTGCTVILSEGGMCAGLDVRGGGPASRESELLKPLANAQTIHAVLFGGGSAFGLDAGGGVMQFLEEKDIGFDAARIRRWDMKPVRMLILTITRMETSVQVQEQPSVNLRGWISA